MNIYSKGLKGAKGGGGGSTFRNRPDNLRSVDTFEALLGLVTGPIKGLAPGGLKNYFIDDIPMEDGSGNKTLEDFSVVLSKGDPTQLTPVTLQLGGSSGATSINLAVDNDNGGTGDTSGTPGDWRFGAIVTPNVDFIDLRFVVNQLFRQDKEGIYETTASIEIQLQPSGSTEWINPLLDVAAPTYDEDGFQPDGMFDKTLYLMADRWDTPTTWAEASPGFLQIRGKTSQNYIKELRIAVPNTGVYANKTWSVRVRLRERDSYTADDVEERRTIIWESIAGVITDPIGNNEDWRGLAYIQLTGKASDQLTGIPRLEGIFDLCTVKVPPASVWNAETRLYTGAAWDGATEEVQWTQCPAFQLKDLIEDDISGISALVPGSTLNKWDALSASKWYAELVPDGKGGTHPRYSMNYVLNSAMSIHDMVQYVAGATGSYAWDRGDGQWRLVVDKPENATALFTKENIVGEFVYSHTDIDTRYNEIIGVFANEELNYREDRVRVFDQDHIDLYGKRTTSLALIGCTNRQEALRRCKLRQLSSLYEIRQVSFMTNRQGALIRPFGVVLLADSDLGNFEDKTTGRLIDRNGLTLRLRDRIRLELGVDYDIHVTVPNPDYNPDTTSQPDNPDWNKPTITVTRSLTNTADQRGDVTELFIDVALPADTPENAPFALEAVGLPALPKQYRILSIEPVEDDEEMISVTAVEIYTSKWDESDEVDESEILAQEPNKIVPSPTDMSIALNTYQAKYQTKRVINVQWNRPLTYWFKGFKVEYRLNGGPAIVLDPNTQNNFIELQEPEDGMYEFIVYTLDRRGGVSLPLNEVFYLGEAAPPGSSKLSLSTASVVIEADAVGTPKVGQIPLTGWAVYSVGNADVSAEADWEITGYGCTASIDAEGNWSIDSVSASGSILIAATFEELTLTHNIPVTLLKDAPPSDPSSGGAGVTESSIFLTGAAVSSTTYPTNPTIIGTVNSGASGSVTFSANMTYNGTNARHITAKIVYRAVGGGAWTDVHAAIDGTDTEIQEQDPGGGGFDFDRFARPYEVSVSGGLLIPTHELALTASTDYEYGILMKISGAGTLYPTGRVDAEGNT